MSGSAEMEAAAAAYAAAVRNLLAPVQPVSTDRGAGASPRGEALADGAEALLPISDALTEAAQVDLQSDEPDVRDDTGRRLLAKAIVDLDVAARLLDSAEAEDVGGEPAPPGLADRSAGPPGAAGIERELAVLLGEEQAAVAPERGDRAPRDLDEARAALGLEVPDALAHMTERAAGAASKALSGVAALGLDQLGQAAAMVGSRLADALVVGDQLRRLVRLAKDLVAKAHNAIVALLGLQVAQSAANRMVEWIKERVSVEKALGPLYDADGTAAAVEGVAASSGAGLDAFTAAITEVRALDERYGKHIALAQKFTSVLNRVGMLVARVVPQGILLMGATELAIAGYVVVVGGDYVDAPHLERLDRVPGVRRVVETRLA